MTAASATPPSPTTAAAELTPPAVGLVRLRVPGFSRLTPSERLQAATLALTRDLGVTQVQRLCAIAVPDATDEAAVAYTADTTADRSSAVTLTTRVLGLMQPSKIFWVDAPRGFVVGERGGAALEAIDAGNAVAAMQPLPSVVAALIGSLSDTVNAQCILVRRDRVALTDNTLAYWRAASGIDFVDGALPTTQPITLLSPPKTTVRPAITSLDRALRAASVGALVCAFVAGAHYALTPNPTPDSSLAPPLNAATPGALFERIAVVAPDLPELLQSATFAGGAWVLVLADTTDASALLRTTQRLEANGFAVQSTRAPGPRLRVSLP